MTLNLDTAFSDDAMLRRVFSWLTRVGGSPAFGSRPIAWYQIHQCHAIDILKGLGIKHPICRNGVIKDANVKGPFILTGELFRQADALSRKS